MANNNNDNNNNNNNNNEPAPPSEREVRCRLCGRLFATESAHGTVTRVTTQVKKESCHECDAFEDLDSQLQMTHQAWLALSDRKAEHVGRQEAYVAHRSALMALANFVLRTEDMTIRSSSSTKAQGTEIQERQDRNGEADADADADARPQQGIKRSRSPSPSSSNPYPACKKMRLSTRNKQFRFNDDVVFRDDGEYRGTELFSRSMETYVRGRNAPPEQGFVDTSGSDVDHRKYHGLKSQRVGRGRKKKTVYVQDPTVKWRDTDSFWPEKPNRVIEGEEEEEEEEEGTETGEEEVAGDEEGKTDIEANDASVAVREGEEEKEEEKENEEEKEEENEEESEEENEEDKKEDKKENEFTDVEENDQGDKRVNEEPEPDKVHGPRIQTTTTIMTEDITKEPRCSSLAKGQENNHDISAPEEEEAVVLLPDNADHDDDDDDNSGGHFTLPQRPASL
ncbi:hypothetical protein K504DRAFT_281072 [Pleomassaria siparia CBS 279.74]|uniref:Uncharacterized protein n=1 Tax=Pleomassaria siparia CBS 279.74 TaxID=1314801 RepID=A0A6G1KB71_9PLEO|nr:hypothetical protein K504DRAFT_281072 [Pleomassaria siparia CBS 279.74]